ncbi:MAG TPA: hypothetical protein VGQ62_07440 [Chloroflexota bacterium]|jgi:hypothetical protein|nr:hypothetical protein [Chloroflexota bacterium]
MMQSPLVLEVYAAELIRSRLDEAARDALADHLRRAPNAQPTAAHTAAHTAAARPLVLVRQTVADGLRALATRIDPCLVCLDAAVTGESNSVAISSSR